MEKYYTPDIEEFHVGFEYECKRTFLDGTVKTQAQYEDSEWVKQVCDSAVMYIERALHGKNNENGLCGIRVKYLDHDDIVSLGFKLVKGNEYVGDKTYLGLDEEDNAKLHIHYYLNSAVIWFKSNRGDEYTMFDGWVKNKCELKKLLKQIKK